MAADSTGLMQHQVGTDAHESVIGFRTMEPGSDLAGESCGTPMVQTDWMWKPAGR